MIPTPRLRRPGGHGVRRALLAVLLPALGAGLLGPGCATPRPAAEPEAVRGVPQAVRDARRHLRTGDPAGARRTLGEERGLAAEEPERSWVLASLWVADGRSARARRAAAALPACPFARALAAVLDEDADAALARLALETRRGADGWTHLALAQVHLRAGDASAALAHAQRASASPLAFVRAEAGLVGVRVLGRRGALAAAGRAAEGVAAADPEDARPHAELARAAALRGDDAVAARALLQALRRAPRSGRYAEALADLLEHAVEEAPWAAVADAAPSLGGESAEWTEVEALLAERAGLAAQAEALHRRALAGGASPVRPGRRLRRLLARRGDHAGAHALLREALPPGVAEDARNVLRGRWAALADAVARAPSGDAPRPARLALAEALLAVGALEEALAVAEAAGADALAGRLRRQLAFEEALRVLTERGYRRFAAEERAEPLAAFLGRVRGAAREHLAPEEAARFDAPATGLRSLPVAGAWLDHREPTGSSVVAHFRRYGRLLVLGQRSGQPVEAVLLPLLSLVPQQEVRTRGGAWRHDVAVGRDRVLRSAIDFGGHDLSGACLVDGVWIDADSARRAEHALRRAVAAGPAPADEPIPADTFDGPLAVTDPGGVTARLLARYVARRPDDRWGSWRTLCAHEFGHVADLKRYLPGGVALAPALGLLASQGFSPARVEEELERRAQLAAIAESPDPDLALAEMLRPLPVREREPEAHDGGYARGARDLVRVVWGRADLGGAIDRGARVLPQLDRLTDDEIRRAAAAALASPGAGRW